ADLAALLGREAADLLLDGIEAGNPLEDFIGNRRTVLRRCLDDLASGMAPAMGKQQRRTALSLGSGKPVVSCITVDLQHAIEAFQDCLGMNAAAPRRIMEDNARRIIAAPWPVI